MPNLSPPMDVKMRRQCKGCPWRVDVDPRDIPGGYCEEKHAALKGTVAAPGDVGVLKLPRVLRVMACHETKVGKEVPCAGWLANQMGPGNNIALRLAVATGAVSGDIELVDEQHERFEDTLPKAPPKVNRRR